MNPPTLSDAQSLTAITRGLAKYAAKANAKGETTPSPINLPVVLAKAFQQLNSDATINASNPGTSLHTTRVFVLRARPAKHPSSSPTEAQQEEPQLEVEAALEACLNEFTPAELPRGRVEVSVLDLNPSEPAPVADNQPDPERCEFEHVDHYSVASIIRSHTRVSERHHHRFLQADLK